MYKYILAAITGLILYWVARGPVIPFVEKNTNIIALLVIFSVVVINSWIINLIEIYYKKKKAERVA